MKEDVRTSKPYKKIVKNFFEKLPGLEKQGGVLNPISNEKLSLESIHLPCTFALLALVQKSSCGATMTFAFHF
jgi:hypothetical protein